MILPNPLSTPLHFSIAFSIPLNLILKVMLASYFIAFKRNLENVKVNMELEALNLTIGRLSFLLVLIIG